MEPISLHPFDPTLATQFVAVLKGEQDASAWPEQNLDLEALRADLEQARLGNEAASNRLSLAFTRIVTREQPAFFHDGFGLTTWEARVDRGIGMLMRPPSRLFVDAGLERRQVEAMPIRLDLQGGLMAGAWIPPRLIGQLRALLDSRLDRMARRLVDAEYDPYALLGLMDRASAYAAEHQFGLIEAIGLIGPGGEPQRGMQVITADRRGMNPQVLQRIEIAITPPKKPGFLARLRGRGEPSANGHPAEDGYE